MTETGSDHIFRLIREGESATVALFQNADAVTIGRTVCAFLNSAGGSIVVGVRNGEIVGIADPAAWIETVQQQLNQHLVPQAAWSFSVFKHGDATGVLCEVPAGQRPPYAFQNIISIRDGARNRSATGTDISALIETRTGSERWERQPALGAEMSHLNSGTIAETVRNASARFFRLKPDAAPGETLEELGLASGGQIRNSALVLFGVNPARWYPQTRLRLAAFRDTKPGKFLDNRVAEGNAFELFDEAQSFVRRYIAIESEVASGEVIRSDRPAYPFAALREAIVNAIVHRDYSAFDGGIWIAVYDDRIEISNAGSLPPGLTPDLLRQGSISRPTNPDIAHVFFLRGLVEHWGIGTRLIVEECVAAGLPDPEWKSAAGRVTLTIRARAAARGDRSKMLLNERQARFVAETEPGSATDVSQYRERYASEVSERQARTDLSRLAKLGFVTEQTRGKKIEYVRTAKTAS